MAVTGTETAREIITDALLDIEAATLGQTPEAEEMALGVRHLNRLMKSWQANEGIDFFKTSATLTLTTSASYTLSPVRPFRILSARLKRDGIEVPMEELTRDEYDLLPDKDSTGLPTQFYYDRQRESALFYVWPLLSTAAGETVEYTYEREFEDLTDADDTLDCPAEWYDAVVKNLAARLRFTFGKGDRVQAIVMEADDALRTAVASSLEGSVFMIGGENA